MTLDLSPDDIRALLEALLVHEETATTAGIALPQAHEHAKRALKAALLQPPATGGSGLPPGGNEGTSPQGGGGGLPHGASEEVSGSNH